MRVEVVDADQQERVDTGEDKVYSLRVGVAEAQILRAMIGRFRNDIPLLGQWDEELEGNGIERAADLKVAAFTEDPVLYFVTPEE